MKWDGSKLHFNDDTSSRSRRGRIQDVINYGYRIDGDRVTFKSIIKVVMGEPCSCTCPDFVNRQAACKHIFAAAHLLGDQAIALDGTEQVLPTEAKRKQAAPAASGTEALRQATGKWRPQTRPQDVRVGKYFRLSDFLYSDTAVEQGIRNVPPSFDGPEVQAMNGLCAAILDRVVEKFGPVTISYGYAGPELARVINASALHRFNPPQGVGGAVDVAIHNYPDPTPVFEWIRDNCVYDRLILYPGSEFICLAWTQHRPRYHCKQWLLSPKGNQYIDYPARQLSLSDALPV